MDLVTLGIRALRAAVETVGWLFLATALVGGITASPVEWSVFFSGGLWIGLPIAFGVAAALRARATLAKLEAHDTR